ncbi:hypothetical protein BWI17_18640 [Betaproteobacteria bacterium GR16-43]|nr:hypothetical protein BWI17_18640 [Betaproteobacteria bacterium GR16-43]
MPRYPLPRPLAAALALAFAQAAIPVRAEADLTRLPLERLLELRVIAASSYEQSASEAPSAVSVITADDIRRKGYRTLAQALESLPGLYLTDDLGYSYLGSRGFNRIGDYNSRFQLSVNGLRTNDALFDMAYLGTEFPLDMALIERIEFAPGPGSSMYGSNAMLGVINIVTRNADDLSGWRVAPGIGSHGTRSLMASFGRRFDSGLRVLASASGARTDGQDFHYPAFDTPATHGGVAHGQNGERLSRAYLRATYEGWDFETFGGRRDKTAPSVYLGSDFNRNETRLLDGLAFAALRYQREVAPGTALEARVSTSRYRYAGVYPGLAAVPDERIVPDLATSADNRDDALGRWHGAEARIVSTAFTGHKVVLGTEFQRETLQQSNRDPSVVYLDRMDRGRRVAFYAQDEMRFSQAWLLNAGVRYDEYASFGSSVNPRLALIGNLSGGWTFKLLYGSAFRAPNAYENFYVASSYQANAALGPERSKTTEAVAEWRPNERWNGRVSAFHYRFEDLIEQVDEGGSFVFRNRGSVTGRGLEGALQAILGAGARASASASFHDVRQDDGLRATNAPRYTAKAALDAALGSANVRGAIEGSLVGPRLDRDRGTIPAEARVNLVFTTLERWHDLSFTFAVYNLFDRTNPQALSEYFAQAQGPSPGRRYFAEAEWRF